MALLDIFSRRHKPLPDVFQYDDLPNPLRVQVVAILEETLPVDFGNMRGWQSIARAVAREHGLLEIPTRQNRADRFHRHDFQDDCLNYILQTDDIKDVLGMVEICFRVIESKRDNPSYEHLPPDYGAAIDELNQRFRIHGVGYQFASGRIVRVDSQLLHAETIVPTLRLLHQKGFKGPNDEFLAAHEHFRHGKYEEAVRGACNAFESTMKAICEKRKWKVDPKWAAGGLIKAMIDNGLVPEISREHLNALDKCLIGLATVGNNNGRHGAGATPREVPKHLAAYALHLAASNIVFLVESFNAMK